MPIPALMLEATDGLQFAQTLKQRHTRLRDAILERTADVTYGTVILDVLTDCFLDRLEEASGGGTWTDLLAWVDDTCRSRPQSRSVRRLFTMAPFVLADELCAFDEMPLARIAQISALAKQIAAIARDRCRDRRDRAAEPVDETDLILTDLLSELHAADTLTADHSRAVSAWCARITERLEMTKAESLQVTRGGLIHDIGKVTTPIGILTAPRRLNEAEWAIMRDHVVAGEKIVRGNTRLRGFVPVVRWHHERYDGSGYPDGLERDRIPLQSRIVTVADAFNAMIGLRPYRPPVSPKQAIEELKKCKGSQFDPVIVDAMIDVIEQPARNGAAA